MRVSGSAEYQEFLDTKEAFDRKLAHYRLQSEQPVLDGDADVQSLAHADTMIAHLVRRLRKVHPPPS